MAWPKHHEKPIPKDRMTIITTHFTDDQNQSSDLVVEPKKSALNEIKPDLRETKS